MSGNYMMGLSVGMLLGLVIGMPTSNEMVVKIDADDAKALKSGAEVSEALKQRTCSRIQQAVQDFRENKTDAIVICPDDLQADTPRQAARKTPGLRP